MCKALRRLRRSCPAHTPSPPIHYDQCWALLALVLAMDVGTTLAECANAVIVATSGAGCTSSTIRVSSDKCIPFPRLQSPAGLPQPA